MLCNTWLLTSITSPALFTSEQHSHVDSNTVMRRQLLCALAARCGFAAVSFDERVRDQFSAWLYDNNMRARLLQENDKSVLHATQLLKELAVTHAKSTPFLSAAVNMILANDIVRHMQCNNRLMAGQTHVVWSRNSRATGRCTVCKDRMLFPWHSSMYALPRTSK
jgi:hypothetical protein